MEYFKVNGMIFELDENGNMFNPNQWKREVTKAFIEKIGKRNFNDDHEHIIGFICDWVKKNDITPMIIRTALPNFMNTPGLFFELTNSDKVVFIEFADEVLKLYKE